MKVNVKILSENKSVSLDIDETDSIESLSTLLNLELNSSESFYFIFNKVICENGKTLSELEFIDDCIVYAAKKSDKPLKRKIENDDINKILTYGSFSRKISAITDESVHEHTIWQNKGMVEIQRELNKSMIDNPFQFQPLILQTPVEELIKNPSIINSLYSSNPILNEIMDKKPEQVKFFTDRSQYDWIQNVISDASEMERVSIHYSENYKNVIDSKRCKRMHDILEKVDGHKSDEIDTLETSNYDDKSLSVFSKSQYIQNLTDLLIQDKDLSETILKSCPFGGNLSNENISEIQNILPEALNHFKNALSQQSIGGNSMYKFMQDHPLEVDEEVADRLEAISGNIPEINANIESGHNAKIYEMFSKINSWINIAPVDDSGNALSKNYNKQIELLNEMGFSDNGVNVQVLASEYGSVNRAAIKLASQ